MAIFHNMSFDEKAEELCERAFKALVNFRNALRYYYELPPEKANLRAWARGRVYVFQENYIDAQFDCAHWLHGNWPLRREHNYPQLSWEEIETHEREDFFDKYGYFPEKIY